jgi:hypothetical protein
MGYDYDVIPSIANADSDTVHPVGTHDPENIVVVGSEIDSTFNHVFQFNSAWDEDAGALAITDFTPPIINTVSRQGNTVTGNISGGLVAYIVYQVDGENHIEKMSKNGDIYSITVPGTISEYQVIAQDEHFNTANSAAESSCGSYSDVNHNTACDDFTDYGTQHAVYIYCTNLIPNHDYRVSYYDGSDNKTATDDQTSDDFGNLSSHHTFREIEPADQPGTWHVIVYEATQSAPDSYNPSWSHILVVDTFTVQQSAIPEFPWAIAGIVAFALCVATYFFMRRKVAKNRVVAG